jgi:hypothetical protein
VRHPSVVESADAPGENIFFPSKYRLFFALLVHLHSTKFATKATINNDWKSGVNSSMQPPTVVAFDKVQVLKRKREDSKKGHDRLSEKFVHPFSAKVLAIRKSKIWKKERKSDLAVASE